MTPASLSLSLTRGIIFGPLEIFCLDSNNVAVDISGWQVFAEVREIPEDTVILNLGPVITSGPLGHITIPRIQDEATILLAEANARWDLIFQLPTGERIGPFIAGSFTIASIITEPPE